MKLERQSIVSTAVFCIAVTSLVGGVFSYRALRSQVLEMRAEIARRLPAPTTGHLHTDIRLWMIKSQLSRVESPIIVMGDSIVEAAILPNEICGHPVINGGVGGGSIGFFTAYAAMIADITPPALVVLSVGINNAQPNSLDAFRSDYLATLSSLKVPVMVVTITPSNNPAVDLTSVGQFNEFIKSLVGSYSVVDVSKDLNAAMTVDGIHLNAAGYQIWNPAIIHGIEAKLCSIKPT